MDSLVHLEHVDNVRGHHIRSGICCQASAVKPAILRRHMPFWKNLGQPEQQRAQRQEL